MGDTPDTYDCMPIWNDYLTKCIVGLGYIFHLVRRKPLSVLRCNVTNRAEQQEHVAERCASDE